MSAKFDTSAYGSSKWVARQASHVGEMGNLWAPYQVNSEWRRIKAVMLHKPGAELATADSDPESVLMAEPLDIDLARAQFELMVAAYEKERVEVNFVEPEHPLPNQMFCADQVAMTPQGAILARPAGQARAGEEVAVARKLSELGVPILKTITGEATFEGADLMWIDDTTAMVGRGHRTNQQAIDQITNVLGEIGCKTMAVDLPFGTMHFMGMMRIVDKDLALCWPRRTPLATVLALRERGFEVIFPECDVEEERYRAMNLVTLGPRKVIVQSGIPSFQKVLEAKGVEVVTVETAEISKANGNVGCLTSILSREAA